MIDGLPATPEGQVVSELYKVIPDDTYVVIETHPAGMDANKIPKRQSSAWCQVCRVKVRAGQHKRKCQQDHPVRWFFYRLFHKGG